MITRVNVDILKTLFERPRHIYIYIYIYAPSYNKISQFALSARVVRVNQHAHTKQCYNTGLFYHVPVTNSATTLPMAAATATTVNSQQRLQQSADLLTFTCFVYVFCRAALGVRGGRWGG